MKQVKQIFKVPPSVSFKEYIQGLQMTSSNFSDSSADKLPKTNVVYVQKDLTALKPYTTMMTPKTGKNL